MAMEDLGFIKGFTRMCDDGWLQGWHERNGGNLTYRMTDEELEQARPFFDAEPRAWVQMGVKGENLAGQYFDCYLEADPKNKYDQNAIKIMHADGRHLGFIPSDETEHVREFINNQFPYMDCKGHIDEGEEYDENDRLRHFLYGTINIQKPS